MLSPTIKNITKDLEPAEAFLAVASGVVRVSASGEAKFTLGEQVAFIGVGGGSVTFFPEPEPVYITLLNRATEPQTLYVDIYEEGE